MEREYLKWDAEGNYRVYTRLKGEIPGCVVAQPPRDDHALMTKYQIEPRSPSNGWLYEICERIEARKQADPHV